MKDVSIQVSMSVDGRPADAADVARWVAESLANPETRNTTDSIVVHSIHVEGEA